ncbi:MAG: hypothetical protein JNK54_02355 [Elusimicrobia bacterium]|jgi:hypothetical protein|nr:hypothetical protein [Elusimicrobiota bacterium]
MVSRLTVGIALFLVFVFFQGEGRFVLAGGLLVSLLLLEFSGGVHRHLPLQLGTVIRPGVIRGVAAGVILLTILRFIIEILTRGLFLGEKILG